MFDKSLREIKRSYSFSDPEHNRRLAEIDDYSAKIKCYKWGTERGFDFYGYTKWKDSKELQKLKAIPYKKMKKKDWEEQTRLRKIEFDKDITLYKTLGYD